MEVAWLGALGIGLSLGLLGSGGSILTVPVLIYLVGQSEKEAIAASLAIVGGIAAIGALPYFHRRSIHWRSVVWFGVPGMAGSYLGALFSRFVSGETQLVVFASLMLVAALFMVRPPSLEEKPRERRRWKIVVDGLVVGAVTGFVGVGGGFLIVPALVLLGGLSIRLAIGTSLVIITLKSFAGFAKHVDVLGHLGLSIDWRVITLFILFGGLGTLFGSRLAAHLSQIRLRRAFALFLVAMVVCIGVQHART